MASKRQKIDIQACSRRECPVCLQIPRANVYQCANGHSICDDCSRKVTLCPTCRSSGVRIRNLYAESLLDDMEFKCSWSGRGCDRTMRRTELLAHEDQCDQNPDVLKLCSTFDPEKNCQFKFTSNWLSERRNCIDFINHVNTCLGYSCNDNIQYGKRYLVNMPFNLIRSTIVTPSRSPHHYIGPIFDRLPSPNQREDQLFFLILLLKVDGVGNKFVSFAYVRLTPERTPTLVRFTIWGSRNPNMVEEWGQDSLPSQSWTQKVMGFKRFLEMVETSGNSPERGIPLPFSLPVSFLSEHYVGKDDVLKFTLKLTS